MARKRPREEVVDLGVGGLYDFLPQPTTDLEVTTMEESKPLPKEDKSKVIFLDVDGVLLPAGVTEMVLVDGEMVPILPKVDGNNFKPAALDALRLIFQHTGASIVISSEWRRSDIMRNAVGIGLRTRGIPQARDCTTTSLKPKLELLKTNQAIAFAERRNREIGDWLKRHPGIDAWVALDDVDLTLGDGVRSNKDSPLMKGRIVRIHPQTCLTDQDAKEAIRILCDPPILTSDQKIGIERRAIRKVLSAFPELKDPEQLLKEAPAPPKPPPRRQGF
jgi:hypothetical protein